MPGVHAVLTHADVPGEKRYGLEFPDQPVLAIDRVRYFGEPVALVAAEHPEQARRAAEKIRRRVRAARAGHRHGARDRAEPSSTPTGRRRATATATTRGRTSSARSSIRHGDPDDRGRGHRRGRLRDRHPGSGVPRPRVGARGAGRRGRHRHLRRDAVAARRPRPGRALPRARRRSRCAIHLAGVGGAFGGREDLSMQIHAAMLALHTNRRGEDRLQPRGVVHRPRAPPSLADLGEAHARRATAGSCRVEMRILLDGGAYASSSTAVCANAAAFACGPYARAERATRGDRRLHEQPAVRRDARVRRRPDLLRRRGADGQARGGARTSTRSSCGC